MNYSKQRDKTIVLTERRKTHQIFIENIVYVECDGYISTLHFDNGDKAETFSILLKEIEEKVNGYGFFRINRNTLMNLRYFRGYVSGQKRCFITETGIEFKVSRRKWGEFKRQFQ